MSRILGIVPVVGREPLAHQVFGSSPLVERGAARREAVGEGAIGRRPVQKGLASNALIH